MIVYDQTGKQIRLGSQVGAGGEGAVFSIADNCGLVAKIYESLPTLDKRKKLQEQIAMSNPEIQKIPAWPTRLIFDSSRALIGYIMSRVPGKPIHKLYGPKDRYQEFPAADWTFLVHVAANAAAIMDTLHSANVVMGDVNEGNFLVTEKAIVQVIDCDSMQITLTGKRFLCDVGVSLWTPPELQGRNFAGLLRTANHDRFGLAVLVFLLLFLGRHPFAGRHQSQIDSLEEAIKRFLFAYSAKNFNRGVSPPPNALPLTVITPEIGLLFERAFLPGSELEDARPTAAEWHSALLALNQRPNRCAFEKSHVFSRHLNSCPWCDLVRQGGPNFFVWIDTGSGELSLRTVEQLLRELQSLAIPQTISIRGPRNMRGQSITIQIPNPPDEPPKPHRDKDLNAAMAMAALVILVGFIFASRGAMLTGVIFGLSGIGILLMIRRKEDDFHEEMRLYRSLFSDYTHLIQNRDSQRQLYRAEIENRKTRLCSVDKALTQRKASARKTISERQTDFEARKTDPLNDARLALTLETQRKSALRDLELTKRDLQIKAFLDKELLHHAKIPGIGAQKLANLLACGVESALDITTDIQIPGIGPHLLGKLLSWRNSCEHRFIFDPKTLVPQNEIQIVNSRFKRELFELESRLKCKLEQLKLLHRTGTATLSEIKSELEQLTNDRAQAEADLAMCDIRVCTE